MENEKRLIDANALIEEMKNCAITRQDLYCNGYAQTFIENAPTVDAAEVVHAKWENVQNGKGCCSNCNRLDSIDNLATHCRYCGAKMDGDGNG